VCEAAATRELEECALLLALAKKHSIASAALVALFLRQRLEPPVGMRTPKVSRSAAPRPISAPAAKRPESKQKRAGSKKVERGEI
jgi:hypothetical protein